MTPDLPKKGMKVWSRDGKLRGEMTGGFRFCRLEGCSGRRLGVRWPDGKVTFPCTKGLGYYRSGMKIM